MKKALLFVGLTMAVGFAGQAAAQTCASPLPITDPTGPFSNVSGDLCTATNDLSSYGGTPSPQNEVIYSFVANNANGTISVTGTGGTYTPAVFLLAGCTVGSDPASLGFVGTPMPVTGLNNGQTYYVVYTADPGGPAADCGTFSGTVTGTLPVNLQSFSVN